jgi:hypothetical protein
MVVVASGEPGVPVTCCADAGSDIASANTKLDSFDKNNARVFMEWFSLRSPARADRLDGI